MVLQYGNQIQKLQNTSIVTILKRVHWHAEWGGSVLVFKYQIQKYHDVFSVSTLVTEEHDDVFICAGVCLFVSSDEARDFVEKARQRNAMNSRRGLVRVIVDDKI